MTLKLVLDETSKWLVVEGVKCSLVKLPTLPPNPLGWRDTDNGIVVDPNWVCGCALGEWRKLLPQETAKPLPRRVWLAAIRLLGRWSSKKSLHHSGRKDGE